MIQNKLKLILVLSLIFIVGCSQFPQDDLFPTTKLNTFSSCSELKSELAKHEQTRSYLEKSLQAEGGVADGASAPDYSKTNIQVEGVDEADIVKTDGEYIYTLSYNNLNIIQAYPEEEASILSQTELDLYPTELFIDNDKLLVFGIKYNEVPILEPALEKRFAGPISFSTTSVKVFDVSDKSNPKIIREIDFEGDYRTARKIDNWIYFVINTYPNYYAIDEVELEALLPKMKDSSVSDTFVPLTDCTQIRYLEPINPEGFVTVAALNIENPEAEIAKEVILGSGQNVYSSLNNLYIAQTDYGYSYRGFSEIDSDSPSEKTIIHKFSLDEENINYEGQGTAPGTILNQFSMDESGNYFRIATTLGHVSRTGEDASSNNLYVFDQNLNLVGKLEDLAPGERIYSTRFIGDRAYMVTFKKVDPLFVIDLSNPNSPTVLGKLKIPGFSDYLHPYDENHIIGIGKDTVEAEEGNFAWYQGLKLAIFDVTDVENPQQLHAELIGDRGTDSEVLTDHKAFLFDKEKNLLVLPVTLAELKGENNEPNAYGDFVFQGAYVYNIDLANGFQLKGRITHYEDDDAFKKSGYYFYGGDYSVRRALYIDSILYTISNGKIKLNNLDNLEEIKELKLNLPENQEYRY